MRDPIIPQNPPIPHHNIGDQPAPPTAFDYQIQPQPEHLWEPLTPNSAPPIMPSCAMDPIYPSKLRTY